MIEANMDLIGLDEEIQKPQSTVRTKKVKKRKVRKLLTKKSEELENVAFAKVEDEVVEEGKTDEMPNDFNWNRMASDNLPPESTKHSENMVSKKRGGDMRQLIKPAVTKKDNDDDILVRKQLL